MRKLLLAVVFFTSGFLFAQEPVHGTISIRKQQLVNTVKSDSNFLYLKKRNPVVIQTDPPGIHVYLEMDNAEYFTDGRSHFILPSSTDSVEVEVRYKDGKKRGQLIGRQLMAVKEIKRPVARFAGKSGGEISIKLLNNSYVVDIDWAGCLYEFGEKDKVRIVNFRLLYQKGTAKYQAVSNGNRLTMNQASIIEMMRVGDQFKFVDIQAETLTGGIIKLDDLKFNIVD